MEKEEILALAQRIKEVCPPESKVEIMPTQQANRTYLVIVQIPQTAADAEIPNQIGFCSEKLYSILSKNRDLCNAYLWELHRIADLHYGAVKPLLANEEIFRVVYFCGIKFALYTSAIGCFDNCPNVFHYVGLNSRTHYKYVGTSRRPEWLIDFLTSTTNPF